MRLLHLFHCIHCSPNQDDSSEKEGYYAEIINDQFVSSFTCSEGHENIIIIASHRYEILYLIGCRALIDGYYREAISSFSASLERIYEVFIKAKLLTDSVSEESMKGAWKKVSSQSERQLGAFIFLFTQHFKTKPELLHDNLVKLRNEVIHKGKIPTKDEAIKYGQEILELITEYLKKINSEQRLNLFFNTLCLTDTEEQKAVVKDKTYSRIFSLNSMFTKYRYSEDTPDLEHELEILKKNKFIHDLKDNVNDKYPQP